MAVCCIRGRLSAPCLEKSGRLSGRGGSVVPHISDHYSTYAEIVYFFRCVRRRYVTHLSHRSHRSLILRSSSTPLSDESILLGINQWRESGAAVFSLVFGCAIFFPS